MLVGLGTGKTPMGQCQRALGLDRQPLSNGGRDAAAFCTDEPYSTGRADKDPEELPCVVAGLGMRRMMNHPLDVDGERRGPIQADSASSDIFSERDRNGLGAVDRRGRSCDAPCGAGRIDSWRGRTSRQAASGR
jgi:hypothetical protein